MTDVNHKKISMKTLILSGCFYVLMACSGKSTAQQNKTETHSQTQTAPAMSTPSDFYSFKMNSLDGKEVDLSQFKGKKVLVVNVASECGYTPQYAQLQQLHEEHGDKLVVLGFPANNFGGQEPGSSEDIATFCQKNFGVSFPMFEKISVAGEDQHPLYQWLSDKSQNGVTDEKPTWNFCKYLLDEQGQVLGFYPSKVSPLDESLVAAIEQ